MLDLYKGEWKKFWKKKINLICCIAFLLCIAYQGYSSYERFFGHRSIFDEVIGEDGNRYEGVEAVTYMDRIHHQYAGVIDEQWLKQKDTIVEEKAKEKGIRRIIDEDRMQEVLGKDWKQYYNACQNQTLTYEEYSTIDPGIKSNPDYEPEAILPVGSFATYYTKESNDAYHNLYSLYHFRIPFYVMDKERYLLTPEKVERALLADTSNQASEFDVAIPVTRSYDDAQINAINAQLMRVPMEFDASNGYQYFIESVDALPYTYIFMLILLAVLISGIFNQEYSYKSDQIMRSVQMGEHKQAIAKILVGFTLSLVFFLFILLSVWGIPYVLIGYYSLAQGIHEWTITMEENIGIFVLLLGVSCFSHGAIFLWLSSKIKSRFTCLVLSIAYIVIQYFGGYLLQVFGWEAAPSYFTSSFLMMPFAYDPVILFGTSIKKCYLIAGGWLVISFVILYLAYHHYKTREIENA